MFENILGHEKQKDFLKSNIESNNISHSYLFVGKNGIGKKSLALEFAKQILNTNNLNNCPDFKIIEKKKDKKNILVEQIREDILKDVYIAPISSNKKVYIVNDFEELNLSSQNTLLKTLEEPPKFIVIILISSKIDNILPTIISRVNIVAFNKINNELLKEYIGNDIKEDILNFIDGSIGFYNELLEEDNFNKLSDINNLYKSIEEKNYLNCFKIQEYIDFNKHYNFNYLIYLMNKNNKNLCVNILQKSYIRLQNNGNYDIVIDNMILKCIDSISEN